MKPHIRMLIDRARAGEPLSAVTAYRLTHQKPVSIPSPTIAAPCPAIRQIGVTLVLETDGIGGLVWEDVI